MREVSVRAHLRSEGFDFASPPEKLDRALMRATQIEDRPQLQFIWALDGLTRLDALYAFPKTLRQASLLFSQDRDRVLTSYEWLADVPKGIGQGAILDAGCGQGTLTRYIGKLWPKRRVVGVDAKENLIDIAKAASSSLDNVEYVACRYEQLELRAGSVALVVSAIGLDLEVPSNLDQNVEDLRPDEPYIPPGSVEFFNKSVGPSLSAWRRVTSSGGMFRCVMRFPDFVSLFGFVEVAASAGWSFNYDDSTYLRTASERFPALSFLAVAPGAFEVDRARLFDWSITQDLKTRAVDNPATDDLAIVEYRNLQPSPSSTREQRYDDGHTMKTEEGMTKAGKTYLYRFATTGFRHLEILD